MATRVGAKAAGAAGAARKPRAGGHRPGSAPRDLPRRQPARGIGPRGRSAGTETTTQRPFDPAADWRGAVRATVEGLRYELVDVEKGARGLLRVTIDRRPGLTYGSAGAAVTVEDCEAVTRQLQYALEVDGVDYARLEVSSPGLDRPLRVEADYTRFAGQQVDLTLKAPFQGRKHFQGLLGRTDGEGWHLVFEDGKAEQVLSFTLDEVREARLVPVVDFKGRSKQGGGPQDNQAAQTDAAPEVDGGSA